MLHYNNIILIIIPANLPERISLITSDEFPDVLFTAYFLYHNTPLLRSTLSSFGFTLVEKEGKKYAQKI